MSNLKRAFSMVMALVMVLGMITIPTATAADVTVSESIFSDANEITYGEAVAITGGIGLFSGTDGKFLPKGTVTRAQMATIIVKMLHGADANADSFKGEGKFIDTAYFEGGWAEGYINWCATLGIVSGYGDGTFKPGNEVTTAEAATMILNALKIDAGEGSWPTTVMAKASEEGMFEDLKSMPGTNKALTREQLAVVALNGLNWSGTEASGYYVAGGSANDKLTFDSYKDAGKYAATVNGQVHKIEGRDSLARNVYSLKKLEGWITANQSSLVDGKYTELTWFDNGATATEKFALVTDESMIGHKVEIWYEAAYKSDREPGKAFAAVEQAEYITLLRDAMEAKDYKTAFGTKKIAATGLELAVNGICATFTGSAASNVLNKSISFIAGQQAPAGTYVIDNETNNICGYIAPAALTMGKVSYVDTTAENESISVGVLALKNTAEDDQVNEYEGIAKDDYVTYTQVQEKYTLTKMETITGAITEYYTRTDGKHVITVNGEEHVTGTVAGSIPNVYKAAELVDKSGSKKFSYEQEYVFYLAPDGSVLGYEAVAGAGFDLANTFFILNVISKTSKNNYGVPTTEYYARGIDMTGNEAMIPVGADDEDGNFQGANSISYFNILDGDGKVKVAATPNNFYSVEDNNESKETKALGLKKLVPFYTSYDKKIPESTTYSEVADYSGGTTEEWVNGAFKYGVRDKINGGRTVNGRFLNVYKNTKYIILDGEATESDPLVVTMLTSDEADLYAAGVVNNRMLCSRRASGSDELEIMVLMTNKDRLAKSSIVYVDKDNNKHNGTVANGNMFSVYNAMTGEPMTITLAGVTEIPTGFYSVAYDSERQLHMIATDDRGTPVRIVGKTDESSFETVNESDTTTDGRKYENVAYDAQLWGFTGSNLITNITNQNACSGVKVIDPRDDDAVAKSGVARITSMDQLWGMVEAMGDRVRFELDMCYSSGKVVTVFVEVYNNSNYGGQETNTVVYYSGIKNTADGATTTEVIVITSDMYPHGHKIQVNNSDLYDKDGNALTEGIYSFSFGSDNKVLLAASGVPGATKYYPKNAGLSSLPAAGDVDVFNAIAKKAGYAPLEKVEKFNDYEWVEYVYVEDLNLLVVTDATKDASPTSGTTPIGTAPTSVPTFNKVYDSENRLSDLTTSNFVSKADQWQISYKVYTMASGKELLMVDNAKKLLKSTKAEDLPTDYIVVGGVDLPSGMDLVQTINHHDYDVTYVLYERNLVHILEIVQFTDHNAGTLTGLTANLRLTQDTELKNAITIAGNSAVVLDLNGYNLYALSNDAVPYFTVEGNATLTIKDSSVDNTGVITGRDASKAMIKVDAGGNLVLKGGTLTKHINSGNGGAVSNSGTFKMTGGTISNSEANWGGAVLVNAGATFEMTGGTITGNKAVRGGGVTTGDTASSGANIIISGDSVVEDNLCVERGANLYVYDGNLTISGDAVVGAASGGNAINANNSQVRGGTVTVTGGTITELGVSKSGEFATGTVGGSTVIAKLHVEYSSVSVEGMVSGAKINAVSFGTDGTVSVGDDGTVRTNGAGYAFSGD